MSDAPIDEALRVQRFDGQHNFSGIEARALQTCERMRTNPTGATCNIPVC